MTAQPQNHGARASEYEPPGGRAAESTCQWPEAVSTLWPGVAFRQRTDGSFAFISPRITEWTGVPADAWERSAAAFWSAVHEADLAGLEDHWEQAARTAEPSEGFFRFRHAESGEVRFIRERRRRREEATGGPGEMEGLWLDLTRERQLLQRLEQAHGREVLCGVMLGFAHDFNNFAAGILPLTEPQQMSEAGTDATRQTLAWIHQTMKEVSQLVHRVSWLAQSAGGERTYHDLNEVLSELQPLLRRTISRRVAVEVAPADSPLPVFLDAAELVRVLLDLVQNATDAMPKGGTLTLRAWLEEQTPSASLMCGPVPPPPLVGLTVEDTGHGLPEDDLARLFRSGFSTKPENAGLGLGLPHAARFAQQNGGAISVETRASAGTTVTLWLPLADLTEATPRPAGEPRSEWRGDRARAAAPARERTSLLWVGDFDAAFERVASALWGEGFHAGRAASWAVAERWLRDRDHRFRAVALPVPAAATQQERLFDFLLQSKGRLKTVLRLPSTDDARVPDELRRAADTTIPAGAADERAIASLRAVLPAQPRATQVGQASRLSSSCRSPNNWPDASAARPEAPSP